MASSSDKIEKEPDKSLGYRESEEELHRMFFENSIPRDEQVENSGLFLTTQHLRRTLFFYELYKKIVDLPGVVMQFGCRWGRHLAAFESFRTIFEPLNFSRKVIGFDTFTGYPDDFDSKDGQNPQMTTGHLTTSEGFEKELSKILKLRERLSPMEHIQKFEVIKGDATETLEAYLGRHPEMIVSLVHMDMNLYRATKRCLELLKPHLVKGSIIVMDEVNFAPIPGETVALNEVFDLTKIRLKRLPAVNPTWPAYFEIE